MNLKFIIGDKKGGDYFMRDIHSRISELEMVRGFKHEMRNISQSVYDSNEEMLENLDKRNGGISSKIGFLRHITMMDIDHEDFKNETVADLIERGIAHTVIESSPKHYWIIADRIGRKLIIIHFISQFIGVDPKYITYSNAFSLNLRAFPRGGFTPTIIDSYGTGSKSYRAYIESFKAYWNRPHIKWMVQEYLISAI